MQIAEFAVFFIKNRGIKEPFSNGHFGNLAEVIKQNSESCAKIVRKYAQIPRKYREIIRVFWRVSGLSSYINIWAATTQLKKIL